MQIYKNGKIINRSSASSISDINAYSGIVTVQSLTTDKPNESDRPAAQISSFIIGAVISKFQSLLTMANITPIQVHIDKSETSGKDSAKNKKSFAMKYAS